MALVRASRLRLGLLLAAAPLAAALAGCAGEPFAALADAPVAVEHPSSEGEPAQSSGGGRGVGLAPESVGASSATSGGDSGSDAAGGEGTAASHQGSQGGGGSATAPVEPALGDAGASSGEGGAAPTFDLIDDFESMFPLLPKRAGRNGGWFVVHDDSYGHASPPTAVALEPARGASRYAVGIEGAGFTGWGVQLGAALTAPAVAYDASRYQGVRFLAKGKGTWSLLISDRLSVPQAGVCGQAFSCFEFVGESFEVGPDWRQIDIRFDDLRLPRAPTSERRLEASAIYDILFNFFSAEGSAFELLVDDLAFIEAPAVE